jgi:hypothetical protein
MDVEFFSTQHKKFPILSSYQKVATVLLNHLRVMGSKVRYRLGLEIG